MDILGKNEVRSCISGFFYLINYLVEENTTVYEAIEATIDILGIEKDDYYDYESIDRLMHVNIFEMCKSIFLSIYDKKIQNNISENHIFINSLFSTCKREGELDKVKILRNCLAHEDYFFKGYMNICIQTCWNGFDIETNFNITDFYNYVKDELKNKMKIFENENDIICHIINNNNINTLDEAKEYLKECIDINNETMNKAYLKDIVLELDELNEIIEIVLLSYQHGINEILIKEFNNYLREIKKSIKQAIYTFHILFEFCDATRFFLNYDRQNCLRHSYALLYDNYFNYCIKYHKTSMYEPDFRKEWEGLEGEYMFYTNLDIKYNMNQELDKALKNYSVFCLARLLDENKYFPYKAIKINFPQTCQDEDIRRHLRNSVIHRNYNIENNKVNFRDYNYRSKKLTFDAEILYSNVKEVFFSSYDYVEYKCPFY